MSANEVMVVLVTAGSEEEGAKIASALVEEELAACVNLIPGLRSIYRWEGKVCNEPEVLMVIKTRISLFGALEKRVRALHSYDTPEVIGWPLAAGSHPYLDWVLASTKNG